ncbi:MAG TPA: hypothetical protein VE954_18305 [Oligoflexus sp.]|uniref:hypothetical protein n=1 Tax=Oligoflexus sp. TaxID=1971216 RepID=UPI002D6F60B1|nr:hypothetical protein [Oligoflexus sp.]HYX35054.1 hypothetical protein [Oligoflexus sp.]
MPVNSRSFQPRTGLALLGAAFLFSNIVSCGDALKSDGSYRLMQSEIPGDSWVGLGLDELTGLPKDPCFTDLPILITPKRLTDHPSDIVQTYGEMGHVFNKSTDSRMSISFLFFSASSRTSSSVTRRSRVRSDEVIAVAQTIYTRELRTLDAAVPELTAGARDRLGSSALAFRQKCGDSFIKQATMGSRMSIVLRGRLSEEQTARKEEVLKAVGAGLFGFGYQNSKYSSSENSSLFNQIQFSAECFVEGAADPTVCTTHQLNFENRQNLQGLANSFQAAQTEFAAQVEANPNNHVMLDWVTESYEKPYDVTIPEGDFYPYRTRVEHVRQLGGLANEVRQICDDLPEGHPTCITATLKADEGLGSCADQASWAASFNPQCPDSSLIDVNQYRNWPELAAALSLSHGGNIALFTEADFAGGRLDLNFENVYNPASAYKAWVLYPLPPLGFPDNQLTSIASNLGAGWKVTFFEHQEFTIGRRVTVEAQLGHNNLKRYGTYNYDDMFSSFMIHR